MDDGGALVIAAGAGMGVDSGLPDFRGPEGFWQAYPPYRQLNLHFEDLANPAWFTRDPGLAWGFYGHRLNLYRSTQPHAGFAVLQRWARAMSAGSFIFTSNVDGQFQRAGFAEERVEEIHGSIHHLQCVRAGCGRIWSADHTVVDVDDATGRARDPLPQCTACSAMARPNVLMFGDGTWDDARTAAQHQRFRAWLREVGDRPLVVVECGAGTAIPSVRMFSESLQRSQQAVLVRINPREEQGPSGTISLRESASRALQKIDAMLGLGI